MNTPKIDYQERINQNYGLIGDFCNPSIQYFGNQQSWNMGIRAQPPVAEAGMQRQNLRPEKPSSSIMSRFESPASAFYAAETYMGFSEYDCQVSSPLCSQYSNSHDSQIPAHQSSGENCSVDLGELAHQNFQLKDTFQSIEKSHLSGNRGYESYNSLSSSSSGNKLHPHERNKLLGNDAASIGNHFPVPLQRNQDRRVGSNLFSPPDAELGFSSRLEMQSPRFSYEGVSLSSGNPASTGSVLSGKTRIRWTQDLHEKFVECVNRLGGAEKATPKAILKLMDTNGLTIFHVKSHLQKYRIAKYMPDSSEGRFEKRKSVDVPHLDAKTGLQLREALQLQLDVQRRLHDQLEIQRNLQMRIEEQGKQLKMMFVEQQRKNNGLFTNQNLDTTSPDDEPTFSIEDIEVSIVEGCNYNAEFPSKIS